MLSGWISPPVVSMKRCFDCSISVYQTDMDILLLQCSVCTATWQLGMVSNSFFEHFGTFGNEWEE